MVNTATLYRSPVRLVKHAFEETEAYSPPALARARKKLMAEIALSGDEILIDDVPYSRNDASSLLEAVTEDDWKVHRVVYAHPGLLAFLEQEEFNNEELKKADAYLYNEKFVQGVSPFFAHSFEAVSGRLLKADDFEGLFHLLNYTGYILPEHQHEAFGKLRTYLDELNYTLRNLSWEKFIADESVLHFLFSDAWRRFFNKLPSSFTSLRDELVEQCIAIVLRFQHKATWHYLHEVLVQLKWVETNEFNRAEVVRIDETIYRNSEIESGRLKGSRGSGSSSDGVSGRAVWWVLWLILSIVRIATCNNKSSNSFSLNDEQFRQLQRTQTQSGFGRSIERQNEKVLLNFLDSLSSDKKLVTTRLPQPIKTGDQPFGAFADLPERAGPSQVTLTNNTPYNCVMLYFDGASQVGSVYEGSISHTAAVYIAKGETYHFQTDAGAGSLHFLFGDRWGRLQVSGELSVSNYNQYTQNPKIFVYEFFKTAVPLQQKYLRTGVYLEYPSDKKSDGNYTYLNQPGSNSSSSVGSVDLTLVQKNGTFAVNATGGLAVKENRVPSAPFDLNSSKSGAVRRLKP